MNEVLPPCCKQLPRRRSDFAYVLHKSFPMSADHIADFVDCSQSVSRLLFPDYRNPWTLPHCPTFTGHSSFFLRHRVQSRIEVRPLAGVETMQMSGWDMTDFVSASPDDLPSHSLLCNLSGNSFNAFAILPLVLAILVVVEGRPEVSSITTGPALSTTQVDSDTDQGDADLRSLASSDAPDGAAEVTRGTASAP